jgi:hypothetical protein
MAIMKDLVDLLDAARHHLTNHANEFGPAKALIDEFALLHRDAVACLDNRLFLSACLSTALMNATTASC